VNHALPAVCVAASLVLSALPARAADKPLRAATFVGEVKCIRHTLREGGFLTSANSLADEILFLSVESSGATRRKPGGDSIIEFHNGEAKNVASKLSEFTVPPGESRAAVLVVCEQEGTIRIDNAPFVVTAGGDPNAIVSGSLFPGNETIGSVTAVFDNRGNSPSVKVIPGPDTADIGGGRYRLTGAGAEYVIDFAACVLGRTHTLDAAASWSPGDGIALARGSAYVIEPDASARYSLGGGQFSQDFHGSANISGAKVRIPASTDVRLGGVGTMIRHWERGSNVDLFRDFPPDQNVIFTGVDGARDRWLFLIVQDIAHGDNAGSIPVHVWRRGY